MSMNDETPDRAGSAGKLWFENRRSRALKQRQKRVRVVLRSGEQSQLKTSKPYLYAGGASWRGKANDCGMGECSEE